MKKGCMWIFGILFGIFFVMVMIGQINSDPQHQLQQYEREQKEKAQNDKQRKEAAFMQAGLNEFRFAQVGKWDLTIPKDPDMVGDKDRVVNITLFKDTISNIFYLYEYDPVCERNSGFIQKVKVRKQSDRIIAIPTETPNTEYQMTFDGVLFDIEEGFKPLKTIGSFNKKFIEK